MRWLVCFLAVIVVGCSNPLSSKVSLDDIQVANVRYEWYFGDHVTVSLRLVNTADKDWVKPYYADVTVSQNGTQVSHKRELLTGVIPANGEDFESVLVPLNYTEAQLSIDVFLVATD